MVTKEDLLKLAKYVSIIHHSSGRIRLRVSPSIKKEAESFDEGLLKSFPDEIDGIKSIKVNKLIGSITISYDEDIFPSSMWEDLVAGKANKDLLEKIQSLIKEA